MGANVTDGGASVPVLNWIDDQLLTTNIRNNIQNLIVLPHIAGSPQNIKLAQRHLHLVGELRVWRRPTGQLLRVA